MRPKYELADLRHVGEELSGHARQRNQMTLAILRSLAGNAPSVRSNLAPPHAGDFAAALPGNEEHLKQRPIRITERVESCPHTFDLVRAQTALPLYLLAGAVDLNCRRSLDQLLLYRPVEHL